MKVLIAITGGVIAVPIALYLGFYAFNLFDSRFSLEEMDLNKNGIVSPTEADYVSSSGKREIVVNGKKCIEYFAYKDGFSVKVVCNEKVL
jgi:hypothetical protein